MMAVDMPKHNRRETKEWFQWTHSKLIDVGVRTGKALISTFSETLMGRVSNQDHFLVDDAPILREEDVNMIRDDIEDGD